MKARVVKKYIKLSCEEAPMPAFGPTDVLVAVKGCGIGGISGGATRALPKLK
jgi:D-arabinose 1-dehydrogenase-like Zn-dependent alcohol dehydrogenase